MLTIKPQQLEKSMPGYYRACREDVTAFMKAYHGDLVSALDDRVLHRRVALSIELSVRAGFVTLGSLRYFTFLCFYMSPLFSRNKKIKEYFAHCDSGDESLRQVLFAVSPQCWRLLQSRRSDYFWELAERFYNAEKKDDLLS